MKVNFKRDYFCNHGRFRASNNPNDVPDILADSLPDDVEILEGPAKPKRARNADGGFKKDDKSTPDVNEAWEGGKAPERKNPSKTKRASGKKITRKET
tara:strand:+ start:1382 stop:1675 length:294 start_codon:yes stop_codon:yes gene_type:complete